LRLFDVDDNYGYSAFTDFSTNANLPAGQPRERYPSNADVLSTLPDLASFYPSFPNDTATSPGAPMVPVEPRTLSLHETSSSNPWPLAESANNKTNWIPPVIEGTEGKSRNASATSSHSGETKFAKFYAALEPPQLDIEDVAPWSTISFFMSLYLKLMHSLFPVVHKPTFFKDLALRRDKKDKHFRAFLLGLGS
jgi:hypothetical protein